MSYAVVLVYNYVGEIHHPWSVGTPGLLHSKIPTGAGCAVNRVPKDMKVQECCIKDDGRSITVAVQAEAVNRPWVLV